MMTRLTCLLGESGMLAGLESDAYSYDLDIDTLSRNEDWIMYVVRSLET